MIMEIQRKVKKMACMISKTTYITAKILAEISQEMDELRTTVLQNSNYELFVVQHNLSCQQLPGIYQIFLILSMVKVMICMNSK